VDFRQAYDDLKFLAERLPELFDGVKIEYAFGDDRPVVGDWSNSSRRGVLVRGDGIGNKSGVYIFATPDGHPLYIGKATQNNLHERTWDHLRNPTKDSAHKQFPNNNFEARGFNADAVALVREGRVRLGVITISDRALASLAETYLQTVFEKKNHVLPPLNRQIG
jgi:hypothetical protein